MGLCYYYLYDIKATQRMHYDYYSIDNCKRNADVHIRNEIFLHNSICFVSWFEVGWTRLLATKKELPRTYMYYKRNAQLATRKNPENVRRILLCEEWNDMLKCLYSKWNMFTNMKRFDEKCVISYVYYNHKWYIKENGQHCWRFIMNHVLGLSHVLGVHQKI